jgi:hypothetical protein
MGTESLFDDPRMKPEEIELAEFFGPPDFLLAAEAFDAENGPGAAAELLRLAKENT